MPDDEVVVSDTSPLLNLALIDRLDLLESQFSAVVAPEHVWNELTDGEEGLEELRTLRDEGVLSIDGLEEDELYVEIAHELDAGEAAAITYAIEHEADLTLLDEREGRRIARRHGLSVTGVIGILLRGEREGTVDLKVELDSLRAEGFWISDVLYADVLQQDEQSPD
ncbi:MAG: DUF3368 domain-containing protein [Natronomonas sp.]